MPAPPSPSSSVAAEPLLAAAPPSAEPPRGRLALARARWAALRSGGRLAAEPGVTLARGVRFDIAPGGSVRLRSGAAVGRDTRIRVLGGGELLVGPGAVLGDRCVVELRTRSSIGEGARLADEVVVHDHRQTFDDPERPVRAQAAAAAPIGIGAQVRIGPRAFIGAGVTVGARAEVTAYAVVDRDVPAGGRVVGVPRAPRGAPRAPSGPGAF